jgi:hypothetical protein
MILIAAYGLIIRGLMAIGMPMGGVVTVAGTLTAAGAAQVFLFRGERPRYASIILGAVAAPACAVVYAFIESDFADAFFFNQTFAEIAVSVYYFSVVGAVLGYVSGCIAAGLFLMLGRIPWLQGGLHTDQASINRQAESPPSPRISPRFVSFISLYQMDRPIREFMALACIVLALTVPLVVFMPWWRAGIYLPTVMGIAIGVSFLRTGLRQLGRYLAAIFSVFSLLCSVGPAIMIAQVSWGDGFATEVPVIGVVIASSLTGMGLSAAVGWLRWVRRRYFSAQSFAIEIIVLSLLIIAVNAGASVYIASRIRQPDQLAIQRIQELDGSVGYSFPNQNLLAGQVSYIVLHGSDMTHRPNVTDDDLKLITALDTATHLNLSSSEITDAGMRHLRSFPRLNGLSLEASRVTDAGVAHLTELNALGRLSLRETQITTSGVRSLKKLNISYLWLSGPNLDASVVDELTDMSSLATVSLHHVDLSGADLSQLARLPSLRWLELVDCNLSDDDLRSLAALQKLEDLHVASNPITDRCIEFLPQMKSLKKVDLFETELTEAGVGALESKMPKCVILGH